IDITKRDWDSKETSIDFIKNRLVENKALTKLSENWQLHYQNSEQIVNEVFELERKNADDVHEAFGIKNKLDIAEKKITLFSNPKYLYSSDHSIRFQSDSLVELCSYSIGVMMGRFSLDRDGIVYALTGNEGFKELDVNGAYQSFPADDDGIIPLASEEWLFDDDATTRFKEFVKTVWGEGHLPENIEFVAESLCLHALKPKKGEGAIDTIRRYFSTQFFKDHCKTYKKRPIYWLFSSGKEKAFECLVYLHRYNEGTLSRMRTEYVTPLMGKYDAQHTLLTEQQLQATGTEARRIEKDLKSLEKKQAELRTFDEQLKHYAEMHITLDLDDGVKANYGKFGNLLADVKAIHGKAVK
ncbi:MAG: SAM-dependent methyltransferase, partial [Kangiellaceae bacterium]|nr:SAM-dependent methyltransferase [Kangiellaceae bacterium]